MKSSRKIAFIKSGAFSFINDSIGLQLQKQFPLHEVITWDVSQLLLSSRFRLAAGVIEALYRHKFRICNDARDRLIQTGAAFRAIKFALQRHVCSSKFLFTFQTQSMWDASVPGIPHFVYTDHTELANSQYPGFDSKMLPGLWWIKLERTIYANATINFTMSSHVSRSLMCDYQCSPLRVQCVGAGSNAPLPHHFLANNSRFERKEILFVGREWERKGGPELLAAFNDVLKIHPDARLLIVGCAPAVSLPNVEVAGLIPLTDLPKYYERASLFCLPTRWEPFGVGFVEAMLAGLPIIGTDIGAVPDFVEEGDNGYRVAVGDTSGLARAMIDALSDPRRLATYGRASLAKAKAKYTWDAVGSRIQSIIARHLELSAVAA